MGYRWGPEGPPEDAYSRVTDPQRYAPLAEHARRLVDQLRTRFDVTALDGEPTAAGQVSAVRLVPAPAAPPAAELTVVWTDFPGVQVRCGRYGADHFPVCGCDACDEDPADCADELDALVDDVVRGQLVERVSGGWGSRTVRVERPGRSSSWALDRAAPTGVVAWAAWQPAR